MMNYLNCTKDMEKLHNIQLEMLKDFDEICKRHNIRYVLFAGTALGALRHQDFIPWDDDLDVALLREDYEKLLGTAGEEWGSKYYMQREFSEHWPMFYSKLRKNNTAYIEKMAPVDRQQHQGIYIDIFPCDNLASNSFLRAIQFFCSKIVIAKSLSKRGYVTNNFFKKTFMKVCELVPMRWPYKVAIRRNDTSSEFVHTFFGASSKYKKSVFKRRWFAEAVHVPFGDGLFPVSKFCGEMLTTMYGNYMQLPPEEERIAKEHAVLVDLDNSYDCYLEWQSKQYYSTYPKSIR